VDKDARLVGGFMLIEEFDKWRKERGCSVFLTPPNFTGADHWKDDFYLFVKMRYADAITVDNFAELAWQVYMLQACVEGFLDDFEEIQDELVRQDDILRIHSSEIEALWEEV
jgi:hypothetical protein